MSNTNLALINGILVGAFVFSLFIASRPQYVFSINQFFKTEFYYMKHRTIPVTTAQVLNTKEDVADVTSNSTENLHEYVEIIDSCNYDFSGECLRVRSGPGTEFPVLSSLRNGVVLKVDQKIDNEEGVWYRVEFDEWLRYPERVTGEWYLSGEHVRLLKDVGAQDATTKILSATTSKVITVDKSEQMLYAFDGIDLFMETSISTGLSFTPTPSGTFKVFRKTPTRYMQGPLPYLADKEYYDLPGVPWNLYFTEYGAVIHGAYWHESFGEQYSHGCVNVDIKLAEKLYKWADLGTVVIVKP